jgi:hypothetical protein
MAINKEYQGQGVGLLICRKVIEWLGYNCGAVLIRSYPTQFTIGSENEDWLKDIVQTGLVATNPNASKSYTAIQHYLLPQDGTI